MNICEICKKEGENIELVECANCGNFVCENCYHEQGGGAYGKVFEICKSCQKILSACKVCGNYVPDEFIDECPRCKNMICEDCMDEHVYECNK